MATLQEVELDSLGFLEERIQQTVALVNRLRHEKESTSKELASVKAALEDANLQNMQLAEELEGMKAERVQVRGRIEKLLGHIDQLGNA